MKNFKTWLIFIVAAMAVACNAGTNSGGSDSGSTVTSTVPETKDFSMEAQAVSPSASNCFDIVNPVTTLDKQYTSGEISITNNCSTNQMLNGTSIIITSNNYSLDAKTFDFHSMNGMYFPGTNKIYYAKPSVAFSSSVVNGYSIVTGTISFDQNVPAYIKPNDKVKLAFGYKTGGTMPGAFSYSINGGNPVAPTTGNIQLSIDTTDLKTVCTSKVNCNIALTLTGQNNIFNSTVITLTNKNVGSIIKTNLTNLNAGTYIFTVANNSLPAGVSFNAAPVLLTAGANLTATATFKIIPTTGNITYTLVKPDTKIASDSLNINLSNSSGQIVGSQLSSYGKSSSFNNINVGSYTLVSYGLGDPVSGIYYKPLNQLANVTTNTPTNLGNVSMIKEVNTVPVTVSISGLGSGETVAIDFTDSLNYQFSSLTLANGTTTLKFVKGDNIVFNIAATTNYSAINPIAVIAGTDSTVAISVIPTSKLLSVNFDGNVSGSYSKADFIKDWGMSPNSSSGQKDRLKIVSDPLNPNNKVLQLTYPAGEVGGGAGMTFNPTLSAKSTHLFFQYKVFFPVGFTWVKGGKLPGLTSSPDSPTGCISNKTFDGFSARLMWRENGRLYSYLYDPIKVEECGDYFSLGTNTVLTQGRWYTLTQEVQLNDPGLSNGFIREWIDKVQVLDLQNLTLRKSGSILIDQIKMDSFFGGSNDDWAPLTAQQAYFDDFVVSTSMP